MILLDQFDHFYRQRESKELSLRQYEQTLTQLRDAVQQSKTELYAQQDMVKAIFASKDQEIAQLNQQLQEMTALNGELEQEMSSGRNTTKLNAI